MPKIYTRLGDQGSTSLLGGTRLPKSHARFHAYGTTDELNVAIGLLIENLKSLPFPEERDQIKTILLRIQSELFNAGGVLACDDPQWVLAVPRLNQSHIDQLESEIDHWDQSLPPLKNFILPGGSLAALTAHSARTICRRAERWTEDIVSQSASPLLEEYQWVLVYLNRLSDHLFTLSRWINHFQGIKETPWTPS